MFFQILHPTEALRPYISRYVLGNISAAEMASVACLSERQFLRIFRTYVGIPLTDDFSVFFA